MAGFSLETESARLEDLLARTSRTFALAIPLLPSGLRTEVGLSYLLLRLADTLEDADRWPADRKVAALEDFAAVLRGQRSAPDWTTEPPLDDAACVELLNELPAILRALEEIDPVRRTLIVDHAAQTAIGMAAYVGRGHKLRSLDELRHYCWVVAGSVGELLTRLFASSSSSVARVQDELLVRAAVFGEALQLVNILKDSRVDDDAGRRFLPEGVDRAEVAALARHDLAGANDYVARLARSGASRAVTAFCTLPLRLAEATLDRLDRDGPGAKISRREVASILEGVLAEATG